VGVVDEYEFDNPSTYDGSEVYSQVIGKYTDAAGVPAYVSASTPTSATYGTVTGLMTNQTWDIDALGWATGGILGSYTRTTVGAEVHSGAGAAKVTDGGFGDSGWIFAPITGLKIGRRYTVSMWSLCPVGAPQIDTSGIYNGLSPYAPNRIAGLAVTANGVYTKSTATFIATAEKLFMVLTDLGGGFSVCYDDIVVTAATENIVQRRGFARTKLVDFSSKMTAAAATQVCQIILDASQFPPLKGTLKVRGHIRRYGTGAHIHVSQLKLGEPILLEDETDPNTGAIGRIGIIMQFTYDHDTQTATIMIDSNKNFVENLLARLGAVA